MGKTKEAAPQADRLQAERGATWMHDDLAAYIEEQTGYGADSTTIRLAFAMRNEYRKTERYRDLRAEVRREKEKAREEKKAAAAKERAEKKAAKEAAEKAKAAAAEAEADAEE